MDNTARDVSQSWSGYVDIPNPADRWAYLNYYAGYGNVGDYYGLKTIFYKGIMPSEKVLDFPVDCNTLTGSVNL